MDQNPKKMDQNPKSGASFKIGPKSKNGSK